MTPQEFGDIFSEMEQELKNASSNPAAITETIVSTYILLKFKQSAQDGIMKSFQELIGSIGRVLASQTDSVNTNTVEIGTALIEKLNQIEKQIKAIS